MWLSKKKLEEIKKQEYDKGLGMGYELGYLYGRIEKDNRSYLVLQQVDDILNRG